MNCLPFIVFNIGQICPNIKKKMRRVFARSLSKDKLHVYDRTQAAILAIRKGIIELDLHP